MVKLMKMQRFDGGENWSRSELKLMGMQLEAGGNLGKLKNGE